MDSEIHYEGWLIKSPPTKRIWRARWRRRYFALKQGELPGQYLLEYYTDQTCRKLKGVIDLDQCEQVDAGLFMEHKFPHVFNVKTPRRTYYLAADSDDIMRYWVNCICNVCGLQDLSKLSAEEPEADVHTALEPSYLNKTTASVMFETARGSGIGGGGDFESLYENNIPARLRSLDAQNGNAMVEATMTMNAMPTNSAVSHEQGFQMPDHEYYNNLPETTATVGARKLSAQKRPENLNLTDVTNNNIHTPEPSPAPSTSSGPYIPICECFSGSPVLLNNDARFPNSTAAAIPSSLQTPENHFGPPLNALNRSNKFDIPNSELNIGNLNLRETEGPTTEDMMVVGVVGAGGGVGGGMGAIGHDAMRSSDESESVFTDDEEASSHSGSQQGIVGLSESQLRRLRPSDSSIENENIGWMAMQRFSKMPVEERKCLNSIDPPPRPPKKMDLEPMTQTQTLTMGPLDSSSCVTEERYEIPRSHRAPLESLLPHSSTDESLQRRSHFYSNAAPSNVEGQAFRYEFHDGDALVEGGGTAAAAPPPLINRNLKPKVTATTPSHVPSKSCDQIQAVAAMSKNSNNNTLTGMHRQSLKASSLAPSRSDDKLQYLDLDHTNGAPFSPQVPPLPPISRPPPTVHNLMNGHLTIGLPMSAPTLSSHRHPHVPAKNSAPVVEQLQLHPFSNGGGVDARSAAAAGTVYKTVDFVKTEAFNRTRQDAEISRASSTKDA